MSHLCYLNMIRCDDCVTSYMDAVHESLIEVLGCSARSGEIQPAFRSALRIARVIAIARLIITTVLLTVRVELKPLFLLV